MKSGWYNKKRPGRRGRSNRYNDVVIETCLVVQAIFSLSPSATEGFLDSIFDLMGADIKAPDQTSVSNNVYSTQPGRSFQSKLDSESTLIWAPSPVVSDMRGGAKRRCSFILTLFSSFTSSVLSFFSLILL